MPISDKKKVQTLINTIGQQVLIMRAARDTILTMRTAFQTHNPDVTGTPLEGNVTAVNNAINSLDTELDGAVWNGMVNAIVPSHRNNALD